MGIALIEIKNRTENVPRMYNVWIYYITFVIHVSLTYILSRE